MMILVDGLIVDRVAVSSSIMSTRVGEYRTAAVPSDLALWLRLFQGAIVPPRSSTVFRSAARPAVINDKIIVTGWTADGGCQTAQRARIVDVDDHSESAENAARSWPLISSTPTKGAGHIRNQPGPLLRGCLRSHRR